MKKTSIASLVACLLATGALVGCSSSNADWQNASSQGTVAAYRSFIKQHPDDPRVQQARNRIESLQDKHAWQTTQNTATEQAYQHYLAQYPDGAYAAQAQGALTSLKQASAWRAAKAQGTPAAYEAFVRKFPNATQVDRAQAEIDKLAGYQVELGRYRSERAARTAAKDLRTRFARLLTEVRLVPPSGAGRLTTLRSQQMSHAAALAACKGLRHARQHCVVVKVKAKHAGLKLSGL